MATAGLSNADLLRLAGDGSDEAWRRIVDAHTGLVWSIIRGFEIGPDAQDDVFQTVWLRLAERLTSIREPDRLAAWLARVARNEAVGVYRTRQRVAPHEDVGTDRADVDMPAPDADMTRSLHQRAVRDGLKQISAKCRRLLTVLVAQPVLSYDEVSTLLDMPVGSIGPTRARCLDQLRQTPHIQEISS